jgi:hypothetical protein
MQIPGHKMRYASDEPDLFAADLLREIIRDDVPLQGGATRAVFSGGFLEKRSSCGPMPSVQTTRVF